MDEKTQMFLTFLAFSLASLVVGYTARRRGILKPEHSRSVHLHTVVWFWSPVALISFWRLPLGGEGTSTVLSLMGCQPLLMVTAAAIMALIIRPMRSLKPQQKGVMILAAAISNHGFTMGAYLCFALLEPAQTALDYGVVLVTSMQLFMVLLFYPVANRFGPTPAASITKLIFDSLVTIRAMPLYCALAGTTLNLAGTTTPQWINTYNVLDILFFLGAGGSWAGIGLVLRLGDSLSSWRLHLVVAALQFVIHPILTIALIAAAEPLGFLPPIQDGLTHKVLIIEALTPTGLNTVMVSNMFHLDARLASVLWLWNTLIFCAVIVPLLLFFV